MKLKIALRAFFSIMRGTTHVFSDSEYTSFVGDGDEIGNMVCDIMDFYNEKNDEANEDDILNEAKDILNNHDGV